MRNYKSGEKSVDNHVFNIYSIGENLTMVRQDNESNWPQEIGFNDLDFYLKIEELIIYGPEISDHTKGFDDFNRFH